jgi:type I restriction enzyme R subunit
VAETLAIDIPPDAPGKTLIFAASDDHADILVKELRAALAAEYGPQPQDLVQKITGNPSVDRPPKRSASSATIRARNTSSLWIC